MIRHITEFIPGAYFRMMLKDNTPHTGFFYASALSLGAHWRLKDALALALLFEMHHDYSAINIGFS
ncbi:MAG: hypothetical protein HY958_14705 [Bacteroidia bacterium]|nr:hypothetical protein [Bacteroidia bacterium]